MENKVPCALLMNDVHVSKDNIPEFRKNWDEALQLCNKENISDLIVGGDLWQSRSAQTLNTLLAVREVLLKANKMGVHITLAEGNHCKVDQESVFGYSHIYDQYPGVIVVDDFRLHDFGQTQLYVMSYFPETGSFPERLKAVTEFLDEMKTNILYCHQGINGALAVPGDKELPTKLFRAFDKVLVGHYHDRCKIKGTTIEYIGSSRQFNFGEDERKGYTILYSNGTTKFVQNRVNERYKVLDVDFGQIDDQLIADIQLLRKNPLCRVKVRINCGESEASEIDKNKLLDAGAAKIDVVTKDVSVLQVDDAGIEIKFDKTGIKKEYARFCEARDVPDTELGLKYLDRIGSCGY